MNLGYNLNRFNDHVDVDSNNYFWDQLSSLRKKNLNRLILAQFNINSMRNKFDQLVNGIKGNIDVLMISETKLDDSFPSMQFLIEGYGPPYRLDRNSHGSGILGYVREDIPCKVIPMKNCTIEGLFLELNLRSKKWLISCSYNPHRTFISHDLNSIGKNLDLLSGDFNADMENINLKNFCNLYSFKNLIKEPTCFKYPVNPTCIDLMLTNPYRSFQKSCAIETGLSDFHRIVATVMKAHFQKQKPKVVTYRNYKNVSENDYRQKITFELSLLGYANDIPFDVFMNICKATLHKVAPLKH